MCIFCTFLNSIQPYTYHLVPAHPIINVLAVYLGHISLYFRPPCQSCNITSFSTVVIYVMSCTCMIDHLLSVQLWQ